MELRIASFRYTRSALYVEMLWPPNIVILQQCVVLKFQRNNELRQMLMRRRFSQCLTSDALLAQCQIVTKLTFTGVHRVYTLYTLLKAWLKFSQISTYLRSSTSTKKGIGIRRGSGINRREDLETLKTLQTFFKSG